MYAVLYTSSPAAVIMSGVFRTAVVACMQGEDIYSAGTKWSTTKGANKNNSGWLSGAGRFALPP